MSPTDIGPAAAGVGDAGVAPALTLLFDRNGNGIPDWKEPEEVLELIENLMGFIMSAFPGGGPAFQIAAFVVNDALPVARAITPLIPEAQP